MQTTEYYTISGWGQGVNYFDFIAPLLGEQDKQYKIPAEKLAAARLESKDPATFFDSHSNQTKRVVFGWSMGALLALDVLSIWPGKFDKAVLISATSKFLSDADNSQGIKQQDLKQLKQGIVKHGIKGSLPFLRLLASPERLDAALLNYKLKCMESVGLADLLVGLTYLETTELTQKLTQIDCPVLLIHGEFDAVIPVSQAETIANSCGGKANLKIIAGAGHDLSIGKTNQVVSFIEKFI